MKDVPLFSAVRLKDGRTGVVVEIYEKPVPGYEIDFTKQNEPLPPVLTEGVTADQVIEIIN